MVVYEIIGRSGSSVISQQFHILRIQHMIPNLPVLRILPLGQGRELERAGTSVTWLNNYAFFFMKY